jgi:TM2 domain-containing membrane protein YozV
MRNKDLATVLAFTLGTFGIHKFYLGQTGKGILYMLFCWSGIPTLAGMADAAFLLGMGSDQFERKYNLGEPDAQLAAANPYATAQQQADFLLRLNELRKQGIITDEQFEISKRNLIGDSPSVTGPSGTGSLNDSGSVPPPPLKIGA